MFGFEWADPTIDLVVPWFVGLGLFLSACSSTYSGQSQVNADTALAQATNSLAQLKSVHFQISARVTSENIASIDVKNPGALHGYMALGDSTAEIVFAQGTSYVRGVAAIRNYYGDAAATAASNRFMRLPSGANPDLGLDRLADTSGWARCLHAERGTLAVSGRVVMNGVPNYVISDQGDKPGSTPQTYYVTEREPRYLTKYVQTGPKRGGGTNLSCGDKPKSGDPSGEVAVTFSNFNVPLAIPPPTDFVTFPIGN